MEKYVVGSVPTVMYIPEYISPAEEDLLLKNIDQAPLSKWKTLKNRRLQNWGGVVHEKGLLAQQLPSWLKTVTNRIYEESKLFPSAINHVLINEYLPDQGIMPHQDGPAYMPVVAILSLGDPVVMDFVPHPNLESTDQTSENDSEDMIHDEPSPTEAKIASKYLPFSVVLMPRSLLIFKEMAYSGYLHGIKDSEVHRYDETVNATNGPSHDAGTLTGLKNDGEDGGGKVIHRTTRRISLTCRLVTKVHKHLIKI
ncbi:alpha-ketoglutarate-dependent dioxygenase alkB homolog 6 [Salvia splendens]|uniref:alpha-ketoglutarate-dependent dioxygenase alkB homolog 6 n=1 Tax=Salvia splendens TaxID=180675 RepID=UPI001C26B215|nr:alpha-ketoglutarate-dependent dioxygenase alkB homolog 6 [Salvia splendens]